MSADDPVEAEASAFAVTVADALPAAVPVFDDQIRSDFLAERAADAGVEQESGWGEETLVEPGAAAGAIPSDSPSQKDYPEADAPLAGPDSPTIEHVQASSAKPSGRLKKSTTRTGLAMPAAQRMRRMAPYAAFAACLVAVCAVSVREPLARAAPWTGRLFAAIGLPVADSPVQILNVRSEIAKLDASDVLIVEGELANRGGRMATVPAIRIAVRDASGTEVYHWTADVLKPVLQGGESSQFRARLASPPSNGRSVAVRFGEARTDSKDQPAARKS
ncbi:MAG: FxLYD domain-containing protein [Beijerinckiaceae bacterium]